MHLTFTIILQIRAPVLFMSKVGDKRASFEYGNNSINNLDSMS